MKITPKIFSVPPYLSTQWENVSSLRVSEDLLMVTLKDGSSCVIPNLPKETITQIFSFHADSMETGGHQKEEVTVLLEGMRTGFKDLVAMLTKLGANAVTSLGKALEHDPKNANLPPLPPEMIEKVKLLHNIIPPEDIMAMPEAEPNCNCMYCQINRILRKDHVSEETAKPDLLTNESPENIEEKDLEFSEWIVEPVSEKLYRVSNKLDPKEEYRVFLGDPIGCTCGKPHCEHVLAVLRS